MKAERPKFIADVKGFGFPSMPSGRRLDFEVPPAFFVIGAPRCGSTSICRALKRHPQVSFSFPKETHFLHRPRGERPVREWRDEYLDRHHLDLCARHKLIGDGSVSYIYAPETIDRALEFDSRARFIAVLRNPVEMIQSYHLRLLYLLDEDVGDFEVAWALQHRRAGGLDLPLRCRDPRLLQYGDIGRHALHLEQVFERAGRDRCQVVLFDDLQCDPRSVYLRLLDFLGLEDDGQTEFRRKRESMTYRSARLQRLLMNPPAWVLRLVQSVATWDMPRLKRLRKSLKKINNRRIERPPLPPATRDRLRRHFAEDVARLEQMLDRDLRHWLTSGEPLQALPAASVRRAGGQ